jgi:hypothetical protein
VRIVWWSDPDGVTDDERQGTLMGESTSEQRPGRRGRPRSTGSSVLTPPTGMPELNAPVWQPPAPPAQQPPPAQTVVKPCACGHGKDAHEHYRAGSDCGACGATLCEEYRPVGGPLRRGLRRMGLAD